MCIKFYETMNIREISPVPTTGSNEYRWWLFRHLVEGKRILQWNDEQYDQ